MTKIQNPEEGRISDEAYAERLRESRKKTTEMKRQYREMRREKQSEERAQRWAGNHREKHEESYKALEQASMQLGPFNRRGRRRFAKQMNVFKTPDGWQHFNKNYAEKFGTMESVSRRKRSKGIKELMEEGEQ